MIQGKLTPPASWPNKLLNRSSTSSSSISIWWRHRIIIYTFIFLLHVNLFSKNTNKQFYLFHSWLNRVIQFSTHTKYRCFKSCASHASHWVLLLYPRPTGTRPVFPKTPSRRSLHSGLVGRWRAQAGIPLVAYRSDCRPHADWWRFPSVLWTHDTGSIPCEGGCYACLGTGKTQGCSCMFIWCLSMQT